LKTSGVLNEEKHTASRAHPRSRARACAPALLFLACGWAGKENTAAADAAPMQCNSAQMTGDFQTEPLPEVR